MSSPDLRRRLDLEGLSPLEVAARLGHLPGRVWLDSAGNFPADEGWPVSLVAADPVEVLKGSIFDREDRARLERELEKGKCGPARDWGFPAGGLCGWIDYEGEFVFGVYPRMLVHSERGGWMDVGGLADELGEVTEAKRPWVGAVKGLESRECFVGSVRRVLEWIAAGDIYQVNVAQGFEAEVSGGSLFGLYEELRAVSPAPMAGWLELDGKEVLSSSPETFLRISGRGVETRPIKGTRPRFADATEDRRSAYELQTSAKEIAELVMITDLLRNDLGRVCEFGSVEVAEMLRLETLAQVHHLVSVVRGRLRSDVSGVEAVAECFPGGSITGAPKKRAMEIIRELEGAPRGIYCGSIGCFGFDGESRFNIAIRTMVREGSRLRFHAGAGIVADSDPEKEYEETLHKAEGIRLALKAFSAGRDSDL
ncbi:hypothetical protein HNR46_001888 [Haloferula luteola]|uniref:Chorismate-utilising enzyme C-terminal domain-containing protein n=1 Tax=Haloferula luteola TaxID=595692 RepID=A0A840VCW4_9BACT|nr:hypothetical protein [Haloferula luteola]